MNNWCGIGRLCSDPTITTSNSGTKIARYRLAVDRKFKKEGQPEADFIGCVCFGKSADFVEKYLHKGMKIGVSGALQTGSYEKDGVTHYTFDILVDSHDFCEKKQDGGEYGGYSGRGGVPISCDEDYDRGYPELPPMHDDSDLPPGW